jgi:hypothetical protein
VIAAAGTRHEVRREAFDQFDDFKALVRRKLEERLQEPQAFDCFARWSSESLLQFCNKCGILHLAPSSETGMTYPGTREGLAQKVDTAAKKRLSVSA